MAKLVDENGKPIPDENKRGYGLAIESLCKILGCDGSVTQLLFDAPLPQPEIDGWVNISDGEGIDFIYNDKKLLATVIWSSRGTWYAVASLANGEMLHSMGNNSTDYYEQWRSQAF